MADWSVNLATGGRGFPSLHVWWLYVARGATDRLDRFVLATGHEVTVDAQGDRQRRVPEQVAHGSHVYALVQHDRRPGVTESVEAEPFELEVVERLVARVEDAYAGPTSIARELRRIDGFINALAMPRAEGAGPTRSARGRR